MASRDLYSPIVNSNESAFLYTDSCDINFILSAFNGIDDISCVQAVVTNLNTGKNVVNIDFSDTSGSEHKVITSAGTILNLPIEVVDGSKGKYKIKLKKNYIQNNWICGNIYKVQIRLVDKTAGFCPNYADKSQISAWILNNASHFSEWSAQVTIKAIGNSIIDISLLDEDLVSTIPSSTLNIKGTFTNEDPTENLYSYNFSVYNSQNDLIDSTKELYPNRFNNINQIIFDSAVELENNSLYKLVFKGLTQNQYQIEKEYLFKPSYQMIDVEDLYLKEFTSAAAAHSTHSDAEVIGSLGYQQDEGCIILYVESKIAPGYREFSGTLRVKRASQKDNFKTWETICDIECADNTVISTIPPISDFSAESGVVYRYGLQEVIINSDFTKTSKLQVTGDIKRIFNHSYLLTKDAQLKLQFNDTLSNYNKNVNDSIVATIGSVYPFVTRVGNSDYLTFSLNGLISFQMDDNHLFLEKNFIYGYNKDSYIDPYDYTYEREFRKRVYDFLRNGQPKLYKSATEGNVLVRLSQVSLSPEQSLGRLVYSFSATATEIDECNLDNYKKYNIIEKSSIIVVEGE